MKKLLALMLVLGMASFANAALILSINGDTTQDVISIPVSGNVTIDVYQTTDSPAEWWLGYTGPGEWMRATAHLYIPPAPDTMVVDDGGYGAVWFQGRIPTATVNYDPGKWFDVDFHCTGLGDAIITLYAANGETVLDTATIHQIPEPAMIALLGLGGLFLRRRK